MGDDVMNNLELYEQARSVPDSAMRPIKGGRLAGKTDINPMWRIKKLTEMFGACGIGWYYEETKQWTEVSGEEIACFVNINLYVKVEGEWSKPIFGTGGNMFVVKENRGLYTSDECFKMATTDALSVACKQLGIGADVYWGADKTKYTNQVENDGQEDVKDKFKPVVEELKRTGYSTTSICKTYKVDSIYDMSDLQIKDFLTKIKNVPTREDA
jgi:hypothetical protein